MKAGQGGQLFCEIFPFVRTGGRCWLPTAQLKSKLWRERRLGGPVGRFRMLATAVLRPSHSKGRLAFDFVGLVGAVASTAALVIWAVAKLQQEPYARIHLYLWTTLLATVVLTAVGVLIWDRLGEGLELSDEAHEIQHRMIELVRECAIAKGDWGQEWSRRLDRILNESLRPFLEKRLKTRGIAITVKVFRYTPTEEGRRLALHAIWRDSSQSRLRKGAGPENRERNYVFTQFKANVHQPDRPDGRRCIVVHDLEVSEAWDDLKRRGRDHGYRTILAFPLNHPEEEGLGLNLPVGGPETPPVGGNVIGFLGIDAPKPGAFRGLFSPLKGGHLGNAGENHVPRTELNFLFGISDAIATLIRLVDS